MRAQHTRAEEGCRARARGEIVGTGSFRARHTWFMESFRRLKARVFGAVARWRLGACALAVLCIATFAVGAWSRHRYVRVGFDIVRPFQVCFASGLIAVDNFDQYAPGVQILPDPGAPVILWPPTLSGGSRWAIWELETRLDGTPYTHWYGRTPAWIPALLFGLGAAACDWRARRVRAWMTGNRCRGCGYELTGLKSGRCPECGRDGAGDERVAVKSGRRRVGATPGRSPRL